MIERYLSPLSWIETVHGMVVYSARNPLGARFKVFQNAIGWKAVGAGARYFSNPDDAKAAIWAAYVARVEKELEKVVAYRSPEGYPRKELPAHLEALLARPVPWEYVELRYGEAEAAPARKGNTRKGRWANKVKLNAPGAAPVKPPRATRSDKGIKKGSKHGT